MTLGFWAPRSTGYGRSEKRPSFSELLEAIDEADRVLSRDREADDVKRTAA